MPNPHPLDIWDLHLAEFQPFADSDYLHEKLQVRYKRRLEMLSAVLPAAGELGRALSQATPLVRDRSVGDPVLRHAIQQALRHVVKGARDGLPLSECAEILGEAVRQVREGKLDGPLGAGACASRLGKEPYHGGIWSEEHRDDVFGRVFRKIARAYFPAEHPCTPRAEDLASLEKGAKLLGMLLPRSSRSALSHTHVLVTFQGGKASCSEFRVGGTIFINREMLGNPWWVAEHLLHESLHQKLYDFRHTHSVLARDLSPELSSLPEQPTIHAIWNANGIDRSSHWDTFRGIAALHVYVHLALFCLQAKRSKAGLVGEFGAPDGSSPSLTPWHKTFERAQYLVNAIREFGWHELGPAGRGLVEWLITVLKGLDIAPPPSDSRYLHLLLDRYLVEATMVATATPSQDFETSLSKLIADEAETMRGVLSALDASSDLERLNDALIPRSAECAQAGFLRFRSVVAKILRLLSPDGYGLLRSGSADASPLDDRIQNMVDRSSRQLTSFLDGSPQSTSPRSPVDGLHGRPTTETPNGDN